MNSTDRVTWIMAGVLAFFLGSVAVGFAVERAGQRHLARPEPVYSAHPAEATPTCARERRMHAYGTYRSPPTSVGGEHDEPIDLTITECLEWKP